MIRLGPEALSVAVIRSWLSVGRQRFATANPSFGRSAIGGHRSEIRWIGGYAGFHCGLRSLHHRYRSHQHDSGNDLMPM